MDAVGWGLCGRDLDGGIEDAFDVTRSSGIGGAGMATEVLGEREAPFVVDSRRDELTGVLERVGTAAEVLTVETVVFRAPGAEP